jgi:hypothetical protein
VVQRLERENEAVRERAEKALAQRGEEKLVLFRQVGPWGGKGTSHLCVLGGAGG